MPTFSRPAAALVSVALCAACAPAAEPPAASTAPSTSISATASPNPVSPSPVSPSPVNPAGSSAPSPSQESPSAEPAELTLPRGGRELFPRYRLVGYSGVTGAPTLGRLGTGPLDQRVKEMERRAKPYTAGREILPVLEIIATVVQGSPGKDGKYRTRMPDEEIETYLKSARKHKAVLLLNIQPGRSEFLTEAKAYEKWLKQPEVGVALDPEWAMDAGQVPGRAYGHTTGKELDGVASYLAGLVERNNLPEKVMVYHQVSASVVRKESGLKKHAGVAMVKSVDGLGPPGPKINTYRVVNESTPSHVHAGFKLFYTEDSRDGGRLMTPQEVLALKPRPEYVLYE